MADLVKLHREAMERFDAIWAVDAPERARALFDRRFATIRGAQWEGQGAPDDDAEDGAGSARMEVPRFLRPLRRVIGEYRGSRVTVDFRSTNDDGREASDDLDGMYRADEADSLGGGQLAYDNAFQEGIKGGMGGWRYRSRYEDDEDADNERQRVVIEPIYDADASLFFDPAAKAPDKSDARYAFLTFTVPRAQFESDYPEADAATFGDKLPWQFDWVRPDDVTLAEYYVIEDRSRDRVTLTLKALDGIEADNLPEPRRYWQSELDEEEDGKSLLSRLRDEGWKITARRKVKRQRVRKYLLSGAEVLEDSGEIPGDCIPLVPYYAERSYIDGVERISGMVRPVIDAVRIHNLVVSKLADAANGPARRIPVFAPEQMDARIAQDWAAYTRDNPAFLFAKPIRNEQDGSVILGPQPGTWIEPEQVAPTVGALFAAMGQTVDDLMGVNAAAESVPANTSAAAIQLVHDRGDVNDFLWSDNFGIAMQRGGRIWLGMARELYGEAGRRMPVVDKAGKRSTTTLAQARSDKGGEYRINDLSAGRWDVVADVGPATRTRRDAVVKAQIAMAQACQASGDAEGALACLGIAMLNTEGEGLEAAQAWWHKRGVAAGWAEPTEEEKAEQANAEPQPDPNMVLAQAQVIAAQAEVTKAETGRIEAETRKITAQATAQKALADAAAALAGIDRADRAQILAEVRAETDSDRADEDQALDMARATMDIERHEGGGVERI